MIILGIDPGSITTGYAFLDADGKSARVLEYGVLHAPAGHALEDRLLQIVSELEILLDRYRPEALSMEGVFFAKNARSALVLGHIRGAILVACRRRGMSYNEYSPRLVKQAVTGDGGAAKEQVANMIFAQLGISGGDLPLDASDALAIAWTHANPAPLISNISANLPADCAKKKISSRKKKPTVKQWENLIQKMGGKLP